MNADQKRLERAAEALDADISAAARDDSSNGRVVLLNGADLTPEPVQWLWNGWLALGKLHILAGAPGQGKTTLAMAVAATVSIGGRWPDGGRSLPGRVVIWTGEDDPSDTLLPRLIAAGADRARCHFVSGVDCNGRALPFDPAQHLPALQAEIRKLGDVRLLVVDPVVSAVAGDSHKNTEVRRALQPLVDLAAACGCAVLGISHFSKGGAGQDPAQRVVGSIAFTAVARVVLVAAKVKGEEGEDVRVLARGKSNIGPDTGGFRYDMEQVEALPGIQASRIAWLGAVEGSARELLAEPEQDRRSGGGAQAEAEQFLRESLAAGPTPTKTLEAEAKAAGLAWRTVRRAADSIGVRRKKGGMSDGWYWSLDTELVQKSPKASIQNDGHLRENLDKFEDAEVEL